MPRAVELGTFHQMLICKGYQINNDKIDRTVNNIQNLKRTTHLGVLGVDEKITLNVS